MKIHPKFQRSSSGSKLQTRGMTLVETLIATSIFAMVSAGFISLQIFGLRQSQLVESKLGASDQSRNLLQKMGWEIRSAKRWDIGNVSGTNGAFTEVNTNQLLRGTALRIFTTTDTNSFIQYYFNTNARNLLRLQSGVSGSTLVVEELTNNMSFQAENYRGVVLTNADDSRLWRNCIRVILEIAQYQYPFTQVGPGCLYDYYKLEFKVSPHCPSL